MANEFVAKKRDEGKAEATVSKTEWLVRIASQSLGPRPIAEITAPEVLKVLQGVEARERRESAKRLRATIGAVFRYAMATGRAPADPTLALRGALKSPVVRHRAAIIDPEGLARSCAPSTATTERQRSGSVCNCSRSPSSGRASCAALRGPRSISTERSGRSRLNG